MSESMPSPKNDEIIDYESITDPEELKRLLAMALEKASSLQKRLNAVEQNGGAEEQVQQKTERLSEIRYGLTELDERMKRPYVLSSGLAAAKQALEILAKKGQMNSIILEGEPGTGKTQWAYSEVGQELQEGKDVMLIHVRVKDTMRSKELLYTVDNIQRLSDAQSPQIPEAIRTEATAWKQKIMAGEIDPATDSGYLAFSAKMDAIKNLGESAKDLDYRNYVHLGPIGEAIVQSAAGKKVYLLIDEIEKGRKELMTGMLDEIENLNFTIEETGDTVRGKKENMRIIITTNTEESDKIPSSFRRRSLYHLIEYPSKDDMAKIVELNFPNLPQKLLDYAINTFYWMHEDVDLQKKPSTPELLAWIAVLKADLPDNPEDFNLDEDSPVPHTDTLLKYREDTKILDDALEKRRKKREQEKHKQLVDYVEYALSANQENDARYQELLKKAVEERDLDVVTDDELTTLVPVLVEEYNLGDEDLIPLIREVLKLDYDRRTGEYQYDDEEDYGYDDDDDDNY